MGSDYYLDRDYSYQQTIAQLRKELKQKDKELKTLKNAVRDYFNFSEFIGVEADAKDMVEEAKRVIEEILDANTKRND